jgi:hypothetical protein
MVSLSLSTMGVLIECTHQPIIRHVVVASSDVKVVFFFGATQRKRRGVTAGDGLPMLL